MKSQMKKKVIRMHIGSNKSQAAANILANDFKKIGKDIVKTANDAVVQIQKIALDSLRRVERSLKL